MIGELRMEYHVSIFGNDTKSGTKNEPFRTISKAAEVAQEGDRVIVHEGVYRECVSPKNGARMSSGRIIYEAAENEKVVIKGSEVIRGWEQIEDHVWTVKISNDIFGGYNPYSDVIDGDWFMEPVGKLHTGQVYINDKALSEVSEKSDIKTTANTWHSEVYDDYTVFYANFEKYNPNEEIIEINVRSSCFRPETMGINYITVRGFEMAHAASQWAPPTAEQGGMLCTNWSKGWIIENNILHDSRCSAVSVGKEKASGHNLYSRYHRKPGYQTQLEAVFTAKHMGWSRETVGSHIIRNNIIYDCGQNAIVGNMGGAFSEIYGNHIYNIGNNHEFFGYEIAGIKLHAAIDTYIHNNNIHDCLLGTWLDWQAQGIRLSSNLYYKNETDIWIEVTHGPHMVDNNIFASKRNLKNAAQGGAYVHNLFCGAINKYDVLNRSTPYHFAHSTEFMGTSVVYGGDDRFYNNIFVGVDDEDKERWKSGTVMYNGSPLNMEEYISLVMENGRGDIETYQDVPQPAYIANNMYLNGARNFDREVGHISVESDPKIKIIEENGRVYLEADMPDTEADTEIITTDLLAVPRISEAPYENADGTKLTVDKDYNGNIRSRKPVIGPLEKLKNGKHKLLIW